MIKTNKTSFIFPFLLTCLGLIVFWQVRDFKFLNYDDYDYVFKNTFIHLGLSIEGIKYAFMFTGTGNWHPFVWMSLMVDYHFWGLNPQGYHVINLALHLINGVLAFFLLNNWIKSPFQSFIIAALFVVHPLRAESVAWISERKDVLSGFFFFLTLMAYTNYAKIQNKELKIKNFEWFCCFWYLFTLVLFTFGLLSKSMLVTVPFLFILLDIWPLQRWKNKEEQGETRNKKEYRESKRFFFFRFSPRSSFFTLIAEKVPFFCLSTLSCLIAINVREGEVYYINEAVSFSQRFLNSFVFYTDHLKNFFWPYELTFFRPYPLEGYPALKIILSALLLLSISIYACLSFRKRPCIMVGWFWFVGMLVPVIGWVHAGASAYSDRYTYLPSLGLLIFTIGILTNYTKLKKSVLIFLFVIMAIFSFLGYKQTSLWRDNETLYRYSLKINPDNYLAHLNLGLQLKNNEKYTEALAHFAHAKRLRPNDEDPLFFEAATLYQAGEIKKAFDLLREVIVINQDYAEAHELLAEIYMDRKDYDKASVHYASLLELRPRDSQGHYNYGNLWLERKEYDEAEKYYRKAFQIKSNYLKAANNLANVLAFKGQYTEAISLYKKVIGIDSNHRNGYINLVTLLTELKKYEEAELYLNKFKNIASDHDASVMRLELVLREAQKQKEGSL